MLSVALRWALAMIGAVAGYRAGWMILDSPLQRLLGIDAPQLSLAFPLATALLGLVTGGGLSGWLEATVQAVARALARIPVHDLVAGTVGLVAGLLIALLVTLPLPRGIPVVGDLLPALITVLGAYVGMVVAVKKRDELVGLLRWRGRGELISAPAAHRPVLLDTSAIIDGRIGDICRTGFLDGTLIVPSFVIQELQRIADSTDPLRRSRGRRGLDVLSRLQKEPGVQVRIVEGNGRGEVDQRLIRMARQIDARVVTSDFNLNKVASLHGVAVLNVNELANALKPAVLPGEEMSVQLIRDGKEQGQGVGYLDDGTMVVVEGGHRFIGETVEVTVTSVLQTAAGRLIFARPKAADKVAR